MLQLGFSALKIQILAHIIVFSKTLGQAQLQGFLPTVRLWQGYGYREEWRISQESYPLHIHANNSRTNYHYSTIMCVCFFFLMQQRIEGFYYTGISYTFYNLRSTKLFTKNISTWNPDNWYVSYFWWWNKRLWIILLYKNLLELIIHSIKLLEFSPWSVFTRTCDHKGL